MRTLLATIFVASLIDGVLTILFVSGGVASEANPFMEVLLDFSPWAFMVGKTALVSCGLFLLWKNRHLKLAFPAAVLGCVAYLAVLVQHARIVHYVMGG